MPEALAAAALAAFFWGSPADASFLGLGKKKSEIPEEAAPSAGGIEYKVVFEGLEGTKLEPVLKNVSDLVIRTKQKPLSRAALERRAQDDLARLRPALESEGYYAASLRAAIDFTKTPAVVRVTADLGPRFTIAHFEIQYKDDPGTDDRLPRKGEQLKVAPGAPARAADVIAAQELLLTRLRKRSYPLVELADHRYVVDLAAATLSVDLVVALHGAWRFGPVRIDGAPTVDRGYIERRKPWKEGDPFDMSELDDYRRLLEETSLFRRVRVVPADAAQAEQDLLPVLVGLDERPYRTVGVGAKYATDEGFGGRVFWQHRNLFGRARSLELSATAAETLQALEGTYRQPEFGRSDQVLVLKSSLSNESTDAFNKKGLLSSAGIERRINPRLLLSSTVEADLANIEDFQGQRTSELLSFPLAAVWDSSNDLLDPRRGMRARVEVAPSVGNSDGPIAFVTVQATVSGYIPILKKPRTILALRARFGSIVGANTDDIPADKRFYTGGGGSIRGYAYRDVGPRDINGDPRGGRSVIEVGGEFRIRVGENFGIVPFVDAGNVYDTAVPRAPQSLFVAAGLGVRYYSPIGPVRLDVGVPLNRRDDIDKPVQLYVSLGQAF